MYKYTTSTTVYAQYNDDFIECDSTSGNVTVYLEPSRGYSKEITIKKADTSANTVTITPYGSETLTGNVTLTLKAQYITIAPMLNSWVVVDSSIAERWDDYNVPLIIGKPTAGGKPDYDYTNCGYLFPRNDKTEILIVRCQLPHKWKEGTKIYPHVHWRQKRDEAAVFKIDYKWYNNGALESADWTTFAMSTYAFTYSSGTLGQISYNADGIDGAGKTISSILLIKLYREDNVYAADALVDDFDIHLLLDSAGSNYEYVK